MTSIESIQRRSLHEELVERLRDMILADGLEAGAKVPERELCERLGVSRTPMREALKVLASEGLVTLIPNRGAVVRALTRDGEKLANILRSHLRNKHRAVMRRLDDDSVDSP